MDSVDVESLETPLHPTVRNLGRLPDYVQKAFLLRIKGDAIVNNLKSWKKEDRDVTGRILARLTLTSQKQTLWTHDKKELIDELVARFNKYKGTAALELTQAPTWSEGDGLFSLDPPCPDDIGAEAHKYTGLKCILEPDVVVTCCRQGVQRERVSCNILPPPHPIDRVATVQLQLLCGCRAALGGRRLFLLGLRGIARRSRTAALQVLCAVFLVQASP